MDPIDTRFHHTARDTMRKRERKKGREAENENERNKDAINSRLKRGISIHEDEREEGGGG